nr:MAG TPA: hypothetical protein [Caudoviricetes sp.]
MILTKYIHINMDKNKRPKMYTLPDTLQAVQHPPPSRSSRCSVSSVRARVVPCMVCPGTCPPWYFGAACAAACGVQAVRVCWGLGPPPAGYIAAAQPRPVSPVTTEKIKKGSKNYPTPIVNFKNFPQKQKDPYKGSTFCAILALQALKGRNLQ